MGTAPLISQLGRFEPARGAKPWVIFQGDSVKTINSTTNTTLIESATPLNSIFSSRVTFEFWTRASPQAALPAGDVLAVEAYAIIDGTTTAFSYPKRFRGGLTGEVFPICGWADTSTFIHPSNKVVTYGIRAKIESRSTWSVNCREYGFRLEWEPIISTR